MEEVNEPSSALDGESYLVAECISRHVIVQWLSQPGVVSRHHLSRPPPLLPSSTKRTGSINYNGHALDEFCVQRTSAYISQTDNHIVELTVPETLDFAARWQGANQGHMKEVVGLEKERNIRSSPEIDAFMKAGIGDCGKKHCVSTDYVLKLLGLNVCLETIVGNEMHRGVSGVQQKRVTTGLIVIAL
ncbi:hypothetical protein Droror1_Dr00024383 [Drosera rotundifolia]